MLVTNKQHNESNNETPRSIMYKRNPEFTNSLMQYQKIFNKLKKIG